MRVLSIKRQNLPSFNVLKCIFDKFADKVAGGKNSNNCLLMLSSWAYSLFACEKIPLIRRTVFLLRWPALLVEGS